MRAERARGPPRGRGRLVPCPSPNHCQGEAASVGVEIGGPVARHPGGKQLGLPESRRGCDALERLEGPLQPTPPARTVLAAFVVGADGREPLDAEHQLRELLGRAGRDEGPRCRSRAPEEYLEILRVDDRETGFGLGPRRSLGADQQVDDDASVFGELAQDSVEFRRGDPEERGDFGRRDSRLAP